MVDAKQGLTEESNMARMEEFLPAAQKTYQELECPTFQGKPFVAGPPLNRRRIAIVSSAGLLPRGEKPFAGGDADYRAIPSTTRPADLLLSHVSVNFDRTGWQRDVNVVYPIDRLNELAAMGTIGSVAATHYSFMGATDPKLMEANARELAGKLHADQVDGVVLLPV